MTRFVVDTHRERVTIDCYGHTHIISIQAANRISARLRVESDSRNPNLTFTIADKDSVAAADAGNPEAARVLSSLLRDAAIRARAWKEGIE